MLPRQIAFVLLAAGGCSTTTGKPTGDVAITNVSVVAMTGDNVLEHHTVVVHGDRILAVVPPASFTVPAGATTIDGTNKWLMPGLSDMHVHVWEENDLTMLVAAGVTTVRNMFGDPLHLAWRSRIAQGELLGPTIVTAGPLIDGYPAVWGGSDVLTDPADADKLVSDQQARGYDFLKPYSRLSREAYEALAAAGKKHGMVLAGHVPDKVGLAGALAAAQKSIEHLDGYLPALAPDGVTLPGLADFPAHLRATLPELDAARLPGLVAQTIAAGTWNCPTLIVMDQLGRSDDLEAIRQRSKWLDKVSPGTVPQWDQSLELLFHGFTANDFANLRATNAWNAKVLAALAAANAPIIVGTDTNNPYVIAGEAMHDEIELMVAAGVPRPSVLRAATAGAGAYLGTPHELGVVEAGARADLLLVTVNPLIAPLPLVPEGVMLRGKWLARAELEAKLAEIARHNAKARP